MNKKKANLPSPLNTEGINGAPKHVAPRRLLICWGHLATRWPITFYSLQNSLPGHICHLCLMFVVKVWGKDQPSKASCSQHRWVSVYIQDTLAMVILGQDTTCICLWNLVTRTISQMLQEALQTSRHLCLDFTIPQMLRGKQASWHALNSRPAAE